MAWGNAPTLEVLRSVAFSGASRQCSRKERTLSARSSSVRSQPETYAVTCAGGERGKERDRESQRKRQSDKRRDTQREYRSARQRVRIAPTINLEEES
jgi:hypothetical protein